MTRFAALIILLTAPMVLAKTQLRLLSSVEGKGPTAEWKYARVGQAVTLHAELKPKAPEGAKLSWFKLEPTIGSVDNTQPQFHFEPITYQATEIEGCRDQLTCPADVSPTVLRKVAASPGAGTMAFQLKVTLPDGTQLATPGLESVKYGGLTPAVHRVAFRANDSYLGYISELFNTPYIFGSAGPDGRNQSDLLIGSDCADLAVYGKRRMGKKVEYVSSYSIDQQAPEVTRAATQDERGLGLDPKGKPVRYGAAKGEIAVGDVIHFPSSRHVAVLYEDRAPIGVLDSGDLMVHTCWAPPTIEPIGQSACASLPIRLLRFK
jgi:hypothetical protein